MRSIDSFMVCSVLRDAWLNLAVGFSLQTSPLSEAFSMLRRNLVPFVNLKQAIPLISSSSRGWDSSSDFKTLEKQYAKAS